MNTNLITFLNKAIAVEDSDLEMFYKVNKIAIKSGYIVEPKACSYEVLQWARALEINPNSTFYKSWNEVVSKSGEDLLIEQSLHYLSTYGRALVQGWSSVDGNEYIPNRDPEQTFFEQYKIIRAATDEEIFKDLYSIICSGVALEENTVKLIIGFIKEYHFINKVDINEVMNKEAQVLLSVIKGIFPNDEFSILRILIYIAIDSTMIIKDYKTISLIKSNCHKLSSALNLLSEDNIRSLSKIFLRFKPLFLAMKSASPKVINKISRLSKKNHTPFKTGLWERCLYANDLSLLTEINDRLNEISIFKKILLIEGAIYKDNLFLKYKNNEDIYRYFRIRNGKVFVKDKYNVKSYDYDYNTTLKIMLLENVANYLHNKHFLGKKEVRVRLPKNLNLVCPTSEKNFVGNIPSGSFVNLNSEDFKGTVLGIYWKNDWGNRDLDLHYNSKYVNIGWNHSYINDTNGIYFSGDITNAPNGASECFYISNKINIPNGSISICRYHPTSLDFKFKFFIAGADNKPKNMSNMVDNKNIIYDCFFEKNSSTEEGESTQVGITYNNKLFFTNDNLFSSKVPNLKLLDGYREGINSKLESHVLLKEVLLLAGFTIVEDDDNSNVDFDFTSLSKNDILNFFN